MKDPLYMNERTCTTVRACTEQNVNVPVCSVLFLVDFYVSFTF